MPKLRTKTYEDNLEEDYFKTSLRMSSYLLAFVVCDYAVNSAETKRGVKVSVFVGSHHINQTQHALQAAVELLDFYEEYFQIPYSLPKLDLVAIPDFESGAMENWGLATFRETSLIYEEEGDNLKDQLRICLVTAHELAHQWFGNLVTMQWWNNLWLNEGFASYMEYIAIRHLKPTWGAEEQQLLRNTYTALERDSLVSSHPVSLPVSSSTEMREMFDVISYSKAASILCMLHTYLSDHVFVSGIQQYLRAHSYNNANPDDLWKALSESAQLSGVAIDVKALMDTWITKRGYPVVAVSVRGNQIHLRQNLFTILAQNDSDSLWQIPFTFYTSSSTNVTTHLMKSKEEIIDLPAEVTWIKGNVNSNGFYRVSYDSHTLQCLLTQLQGALTGLSVSDRAGLIDDSFQLARQGTMQYRDAFTLSLYLKKEEEFLPITVFVNHMTNMIVKFSFKKKPCITRLLKAHLWSLFGRLARTQLWEDTGSLSDQSRRMKLLELAIREGRSPATEQEALRLFHFWMAKDGHHPLPLALRGLIFRVGVLRGGHDEWMFLIQRYCKCTSNKERVLILTALCHTTSESKILWLLSASLRNHVIKTQDFSIIVEQLAPQPRVNNLVWKFLQRNWDTLVSTFSLGSSYLSGIVTITTSHFICMQKYNEVYDFFVRQKKLGNLHFVRRSLEMIQVNMHWLKTNTETIRSWLQKTYPTTFKTYPYCKKDVTYRFKWGTTIYLRL
ncbi:endoplasmic reticulum aminopeptidase 1-like [Aplochiton taeniatus]